MFVFHWIGPLYGVWCGESIGKWLNCNGYALCAMTYLFNRIHMPGLRPFCSLTLSAFVSLLFLFCVYIFPTLFLFLFYPLCTSLAPIFLHLSLRLYLIIYHSHTIFFTYCTFLSIDLQRSGSLYPQTHNEYTDNRRENANITECSNNVFILT